MEKTLVQASGDVFSKALEHPKMHDGFPPQDGAYSCSSRDGSMRFSQYSLVMHNKHVLRLLQVATECVWSGRSYVKLHGQAVICASWCMDKGFEHRLPHQEIRAMPRTFFDPMSWGYTFVFFREHSDRWEPVWGPQTHQTWRRKFASGFLRQLGPGKLCVRL